MSRSCLSAQLGSLCDFMHANLFLNLLQFVAAVAAAASVNGAAVMGWIDSVVVLSYVQHAKRENHQH